MLCTGCWAGWPPKWWWVLLWQKQLNCSPPRRGPRARLFLLWKGAEMGDTGNHHQGTSSLLLLDKWRTGKRRAVNVAAGRTEILHQPSFPLLSSHYTKGRSPSQQPQQPDAWGEPSDDCELTDSTLSQLLKNISWWPEWKEGQRVNLEGKGRKRRIKKELPMVQTWQFATVEVFYTCQFFAQRC